MNPLTKHIASRKLDALAVLNDLDARGLISSHCMSSEDVAWSDAAKAAEILDNENPITTMRTIRPKRTRESPF